MNKYGKAVLAVTAFLTGITLGIFDRKRKADKKLVLVPAKEKNPGVSYLPLGMYMTVTDYDDQDMMITAVISNQSGFTMSYGEDYEVQRKGKKEWEDLEPKEPLCYADTEYELEDLKEVTVHYDLSVYGKLTKGTYRLCKENMFAEFTLDYE